MALKNVTITLEEAVARWARVRAAEQNTSVSKLLGRMLTEKMEQEGSYERARKEFLAFQPVAMGKPGEPLPARDEIYDRSGLR